MRFDTTASTRFRTRRGRRILLAQIATLAAVPLALWATPDPPSRLSGAPGEGTCASCHSGSSTASGSVSVTFPGGASYTPGTPQTLQVRVAESGKTRWGFELSARNSGNAQAGSFSAAGNSQVLTSGGIQYVAETSGGTQAGTANSASWSFTWTPPAAGAGAVTIYVVGLACNNNGGTSGDDTFTASYTLSEAAGGGGGNTLTLTPAALTFNSNNGSTPAPQTFQAASSGASVAFTTTVSTSSGGAWLSAAPSGGNTPMNVSVSANPAGLAPGTYAGTVSVASASVSNSPQNVAVTFNVTGNGGGGPTLSVSPAALNFNSTNGQSVAPQTVQATSAGSPLTFSASAGTNSGGNWLSVSPSGGTTPASVSVSVAPASLSPGTYTGSVQFTAPGATNSPRNVAVTLVVGPAQPPTGIPNLTFSFQVVDRQSGGNQRVLLAGQGSASNGQLSGGGRFTVYSGSGRGDRQVLSTGSWTVTQAGSFTPATRERESGSGGILTAEVQLTPMGGAPLTGTMRIAGTGSDAGVTLTLSDGTTFVPTGVGQVSIRARGASDGGGDNGDDGGESGDRRPRIRQ